MNCFFTIHEKLYIKIFSFQQSIQSKSLFLVVWFFFGCDKALFPINWIYKSFFFEVTTRASCLMGIYVIYYWGDLNVFYRNCQDFRKPDDTYFHQRIHHGLPDYWVEPKLQIMMNFLIRLDLIFQCLCQCSPNFLSCDTLNQNQKFRDTPTNL